MEPREAEQPIEKSQGEPRRAEPSAELERGGARGAQPPLGSPSAPGAVQRGDVRRRYTPQRKRELLAAYAASGQTMADFAAAHGLSTASLCKWRKRVSAEGEAGLAPRPNPRNARGPHRGAASYTPEQRRAAVEAFLVAGQTLKDFARLWGVSKNTLAAWVKRHRAAGPKALEPQPRRPRAQPAASKGGVGRRLAQPVRELIARIRGQHDYFGLKRIRDVLLRFHALKVSTGGVRSALVAQGLAPTVEQRRRRRRAPPKVRSFERALPMQLWQSDITSFLIGRHRERVYLTVFLDDMSRYVVSFALHLQQKSALVLEALKDGMARFGKPREVLTDQGRQYFAWRGKSEFQRFLKREGIAHVVARSHHPQTVGKCERLWETLKRELIERVELEGLADARARLERFFVHYNHFRPHQGIGGLVPADRFFQAQDALRAALEQQLERNALALALEQAPPPAVFLFGQIGEEQVALHGERGRVVIETSRGGRTAMAAERIELRSPRDGHDASDPRVPNERAGAVQERWIRDALPAPPSAASAAQVLKEQTDECGPIDGGSGGQHRIDGGERTITAPAADAALHEARALQGGAAHAAPGEGPVGSGERGGEDQGARDLRGDAAALAREAQQGGGGGAVAAHAAARVAALPAGAGGDGGGAVAAAALAAPSGRDADATEAGRGPQAAPEADRRTRAQAQDRGGRDPAPAGVSGASGEGKDTGGEEGQRGDDGGGAAGAASGGGGGGRPGAQEEALRDAQIDCPRQSDSGCGAG